jgi:hypothetical protein
MVSTAALNRSLTDGHVNQLFACRTSALCGGAAATYAAGHGWPLLFLLSRQKYSQFPLQYSDVPYLALPNGKNTPPFFAKSPANRCVTLPIALPLFLPEVCVRCRLHAPETATVHVPETPVDKDNLP